VSAPRAYVGPPRLSSAEYERLAIIMEEMGEVIQIIGKVLRHGYDGHHPATPLTTNRELLQVELGDVLAMISLMHEAGDIDDRKIELHAKAKFARLESGAFVYYQKRKT